MRLPQTEGSRIIGSCRRQFCTAPERPVFRACSLEPPALLRTNDLSVSGAVERGHVRSPIDGIWQDRGSR